MPSMSQIKKSAKDSFPFTLAHLRVTKSLADSAEHNLIHINESMQVMSFKIQLFSWLQDFFFTCVLWYLTHISDEILPKEVFSVQCHADNLDLIF